jgi:hypothetical protein
MRDSIAPRRAERFLEALGASPEFGDAVIGDLAEEYALREAWDGPRDARRWYHRECWRVAPYLMRDWWRNLRGRDVRSMARALALASIASFFVDRVTHFALFDVLERAGFPSFGTSALVWMFLTVQTVNFSLGAFGGYVAARLKRDAPIPAAIAFGGLWLVFGLMYIAAMEYGSFGVIAISAVNLSVVFAGTLFGGVLGASRVADKREELSAH